MNPVHSLSSFYIKIGCIQELLSLKARLHLEVTNWNTHMCIPINFYNQKEVWMGREIFQKFVQEEIWNYIVYTIPVSLDDTENA